MDLLNRISTAIRAAAHDLFAEEEPTPEDRAASLLKTAQQRTSRLDDQLAQAVAREKRAEQAWRDGLARVNALEVEVDAAVRAGQDEVARAKLAQLNQAQIKAQQFSDSWHTYAAASEKLRIEIQDLHAQLDEARRRLQQVGEREGSAGGQEDLQHVQREQRKDAAQVGDELKAREEQVARREDDVAAREELDQSRIADLLKKRDPGSGAEKQ
jgi:phage shock protein A